MCWLVSSTHLVVRLSGVVWIIFTTVWACRDLLNVWLKQFIVQDSAAQNSCWMMLSSFGSLTLAALKNSHNNRLYAPGATKKKDIGAKCFVYLRTKMTLSQLLSACLNWTALVWRKSITESESLKSVTVTCFCHNKQLPQQVLPVVCQFSGKFRNSPSVQIVLVFWHCYFTG